MRRVPLPRQYPSPGEDYHPAILVVEKHDYPLTLKAVENAHKKLKTGIPVWRKGVLKNKGGLPPYRGYFGERRIIIDFWNGPGMFKGRRALMHSIRYHNSIWRSGHIMFPAKKAP